MGDCSIFDEDEVCVPANGGFKYGLVIESHEYASSDEEFEHVEGHIKKGTVKVAWHPKGEEAVVEEKQLILADRSLMPGDVIRRLISGKESQRGFIQDLEVKCHLKVIGTDLFIYNVDAKDIKPIQIFDPEPYVTLNSWIGQVMEVNEEITVKFPDGARCKLENAQNLGFDDVNDRRKQYSEFFMRNFYVGQMIAGSWMDYEDAKWLQSTRHRGPGKLSDHMYSVPVVVEEVCTKSVNVHWICKGFTKNKDDSAKLTAPSEWIEGDDLKRLLRMECFDYCHRQLGDKCSYTIKSSDTMLRNMSPRQHSTPDVIELMSKEQAIVLGTNTDGIVVVHGGSDLETNKAVDQKSVTDRNAEKNVSNDGACADDEFEDVDDDEDEESSDSSSSYSEHRPMMPRRHGRKKGSLQTQRMRKLKTKRKKKKLKSSNKDVKPGDTVPVEIWYTFSLTDVMWQDGSVEKKIPSPELFPIHHLDEMEFFPGDFVTDNRGNDKNEYGVVESCDHRERTVKIRWMKPYTPGKTQRPEEVRCEELSVYDIKDHPDYKFRPGNTVIRVGGYENADQEIEAVGQVYRIEPQGNIQVWWPSGAITQCYPQDLYIVSELLSESGSSNEWTDDDEEEEEGSDMSWETEGEETDTQSEPEDFDKAEKKDHLTDDKRQNIDELLLRVNTALKGLIEVFLNMPGSFLKNSKEVFEDILFIFKRCKEMERILKSSYFDDDEMADLMTEVRDQLRREKTSAMTKHVYEVFKYRINPQDDIENSDGSQSCDKSSIVNGNCAPLNGATEETINQDKLSGNEQSSQCCQSDEKNLPTAVGSCLPNAIGRSLSDDRDTKMDRIKQALRTYTGGIDDRIWQDIIDISILSAEGNKSDIPRAKSEGQCISKVLREADNQCMSKSTHCGSEKMRNICDAKNHEAAVVNGMQVGDSDISHHVKECSIATEPSEMNHGDGPMDKVGLSHDKLQDELTKKPADSETEFDIDEERIVLPASHKSLCLRVCKAINSRVTLLQEELQYRHPACMTKPVFPENPRFLDFINKVVEAAEMDSSEAGLGHGDCAVKENVKEMKELDQLAVSENGDGSVTNGAGKPNNTDGENADGNAAAKDEMDKRFELLPDAPSTHRFYNQENFPVDMKAFNMAVRKELMLLGTSLPDGILVKAFEDRMDLFSVLIYGPAHTPYEDGLFVFDVQLPDTYPTAPPVFHYLSFCKERLNPNLYENGKVCVSLLGTWSGKGNEVWTNKSNMLQVLVSIQGLILVAEPYFNEAGYERQRGSQHGQENSRMYNEMAILKMVQSMTQMAVSPPALFKKETRSQLRTGGLNLIRRIQHWLDKKVTDTTPPNQSDVKCGSCDKIGDQLSSCTNSIPDPDFPLLPVSKGFCITMRKHLNIFKDALSEHILKEGLDD